MHPFSWGAHYPSRRITLEGNRPEAYSYTRKGLFFRMVEHWSQLGNDTNYTVKLANIALRTQRLIVAQKIDRLIEMSRIHSRALRRVPGGKRKLQELLDTLKQMKRGLRGNHGQ